MEIRFGASNARHGEPALDRANSSRFRAATKATVGDAATLWGWFMIRIARSIPGLAPLLVMLVTAARADVPEHCRLSIPADEAHGFVPLPRGDVFCPLIADPKSGHSFLSYQRERSSVLEADFGAVGIADQFALFRWGGPNRGEGVQLGLAGAVFAQFDLETASLDLINADYVIGLPITWRLEGFSTRLRMYHQSSHLGDEFLLRNAIPVARENLSFEAAEWLLSQDIGPLRLYGGAEYLTRSEPDLDPGVVHGGVELRPASHLVTIGSFSSVHFVAALDVKAAEQEDWSASYSARAGFELSRPHGREVAGRTWGVLFEYYDGPSPYGQFYRHEMKFFGIGLHFMP
jgi:hypothetical protein